MEDVDNNLPSPRHDLSGDQGVPMTSRAGWKWYGYAGHLCVGKRCAFHLATRIGGFLISTVGDYYPPNSSRRETIGCGTDDFFETFVFHCQGDDKNGNPIIDPSEIDGERYADSNAAENGHYRYCEKYAEGK